MPAPANVWLPIVVDERVERDARAEPERGGTQREVVVLEVAGAEALVETADGVDDLAPQEHAEADDAHGLGGLPRERIGAGRRVGRELLGRVVDRVGHLLRAGDPVRDRADDADAGLALEHVAHASEPAVGDDRVVVEQHRRAAAGEREALVVAGCEAEVHRVADDAEIVALGRPAGEQIGGLGRGSVVDEHDLVRLGRVLGDRVETRLGELGLIDREHDDRGQRGIGLARALGGDQLRDPLAGRA